MPIDTATINVYVQTFHDLNDLADPKRFCELENPATGGTPLEIATGSSSRVILNAAQTGIIIKKPLPGANKKIELTFAVFKRSAGPNRYSMAGVAFDSKRKFGLGDDFDLGTIAYNRITILNKFARRGEWKLYLLVEHRAAGGEMGIIDPGIENSEQEQDPRNPRRRTRRGRTAPAGKSKGKARSRK